MLKYTFCLYAAAALVACASSPSTAGSYIPSHARSQGPQSAIGLSLPDTVVYAQKDPQWGFDRMGGSGHSMEAEGCLVTAAAMALTNLGFKINPGELNAQLKREGGYTKTGLLVWSGIDRVTGGIATARFHDQVSDEIIQSCMRDGFYPMARFILPNGRTHWSMIVRASAQGYHMRDPLHPSSQPLIFPAGVSGFQAIRCVGRP